MQTDGIIVKAVAGVFDVYTNDGVISAFAAGRFRKERITPLVGDRVAVLCEKAGNSIVEIYPRKNHFLRPTVANVDTLVITLAPCAPEPDLLLVDYLVLACRKNDVRPLLCINKRDLDALRAEEIAAEYRACGIEAAVISTYEKTGLAELRAMLKEGIVCFCGQSAVGKSSTLNELIPDKNFQTGQLSKHVMRGKNTTRHCELTALEQNLFLADTPGFSLLEAPEISPAELEALYTEFEPYREKCRFSGCAHVNEPDCAVKQAVKDGILPAERHERYKIIHSQISEKWRKRYD